jgi:hypothetical protein
MRRLKQQGTCRRNSGEHMLDARRMSRLIDRDDSNDPSRAHDAPPRAQRVRRNAYDVNASAEAKGPYREA